MCVNILDGVFFIIDIVKEHVRRGIQRLRNHASKCKPFDLSRISASSSLFRRHSLKPLFGIETEA